VRRRPGEPTLAALAAAGGPEVEVAAAAAGHVLGTAASWMVALTAPRVVVLSGALALAPPAMREALEAVLAERSLPREPVTVVTGELGDDAAVRGAVLLALDEAGLATRLDA